MNQPPRTSRQSDRPPDWRRPRGVSAGTWAYAHQREIADHYDRFVADTPLCELDRQLLEEWFPVRKSEATSQKNAVSHPVVLDLGCGTGRAALLLCERGYRVIGIDLSQTMLERLLEKLNGRAGRAVDPAADSCHVAGMIQTIRANLVELGCLAQNTADAGICLFSTLGMIQGRSQRREVLRHTSRIVCPGGRLVVHAHNRWAALREPQGLRRTVSSWVRAATRSDHEFGDDVYAYRGLEKMFLHRFSRRELCADLRATGWSVVDCVGVSLEGGQRRVPRWPLQLNCGGFILVARNRCGEV